MIEVTQILQHRNHLQNETTRKPLTQLILHLDLIRFIGLIKETNAWMGMISSLVAVAAYEKPWVFNSH